MTATDLRTAETDTADPIAGGPDTAAPAPTDVTVPAAATASATAPVDLAVRIPRSPASLGRAEALALTAVLAVLGLLASGWVDAMLPWTR
ncbi:hypothetical protein F0L68_26700 [Solihabitans fulvus]|uniref:Uncharacterized protein n=1 Tax=Solihabitans fulvus TaxID=1892852 RepID=A0A5B2WXT1_9PSEU|nr:hypothetical protein [Solihabitans fulvus]KAA2256371.1 hypothetical protein F0L68_26700 [Solihabitans fulvus]